jgi:hypothetical protein
MRWLSKAVLGKSFSLGIVFGLVGAVACGSSNDLGATFANTPDASTGGPGGGGGIFDLDASRLSDVIDLDAYYVNDPPPRWCGPAGGATPPPAPGGTAECPSDKNRQGCPCSVEGETAACWPGPRANRNLGVCMDGKTTCVKSGEVTTSWGACVGAVLPTPGAKKGAAACSCFSAGKWDIKNVIPCFYDLTVNNVKTSYSNSSTGNGDCSHKEKKPTLPFSANTLNVDCEGTFDLCMVIKAGDIKNPQPSDCAMMDPLCTGPTDYPKKNVEKAFPDLKSWEASSPAQKACADAFRARGGYAELSVVGKSYTCDDIDDGSGQRFVFQRFPYCAIKCGDPAHMSDPECVGCTNGASGEF